MRENANKSILSALPYSFDSQLIYILGSEMIYKDSRRFMCACSSIYLYTYMYHIKIYKCIIFDPVGALNLRPTAGSNS